jgi:hypothetical protein
VTLWKRDVEFRRQSGQLFDRDPPMHQGTALWTKPSQIAARCRDGEMIGQSAVRTARRPASETVKLVIPTRRFSSPTSLSKKSAQFRPLNEERARFIDGLKPLSQPVQNGALVNAKQLRRLRDGIASVDLDQAQVQAACTHEATPVS